MKISYSWLKVHIDLDISAQDLSGHLLRLGFEVSGIERLGPKFTGVVVGKVLSRDKHPNADKLSVCVVDDGAQKWNVVCGAPNVAAGQTIAFARVGAVLPGDFKIGKAKLRGVESHGMICSRTELGLSPQTEGIWAMEEGPQPGTDVGSLLGPADDVLDVEITSNRPDCLSHRGLARELAAYFRLPLKPLDFKLAETSTKSLPVTVEDAAACPFYSLRLIEGVKVGPSPDGIRRRLEAVGQRPVNSIVDVTNFVLNGLGQPLHAFDADKLAGGRIIVRRSKAGESFVALDKKDYKLPAGLLVIADAEKPVALAGVMGGLDSAVTERTTRVALESAYFRPSDVRRSSSATRLRSESSYRFERGADPQGAAFASARAASFVLEIAGGTSGRPTEIAAPLPTSTPIRTSVSALNGVLGTAFTAEAVTDCLKAIAHDLRADGSSLIFTPPSWRRDLANDNDLAEEVGRLIGYDQIPYRMTAVAPKIARVTPLEHQARCARARLSALGLREAYNYDLLPEKLLEICRIAHDRQPHVANPLSEDWAVLRPSLLPGLLKNAAHNISRGADAIRLFEIGKTYSSKASEIDERWRVAALMLGPVLDARWKTQRAERADIYDAKAVVESLFQTAGRFSWTDWDPADTLASAPLFHPVNRLSLKIDGVAVAAVGCLHPRVARALDLEREGVVMIEADLDWLAGRETTKARFSPFSELPSSRRDLALVVDRGIPYGRIQDAVNACAIAELKDMTLFDVFEGKSLPAGKKSLAVRLTFGSDQRTLTDIEVNGFIKTIVGALDRELGATLRT